MRTKELEVLLEAARSHPEDPHMARVAAHLAPVVDAIHGLPVDRASVKLHGLWVKAMLARGEDTLDSLLERPLAAAPEVRMAFVDEICPGCLAEIGSRTGCMALGFVDVGVGLRERQPSLIRCRSCGAPEGEYHHVACPNDRCAHGIWAACGLCGYFARGHDNLEGIAREMNRRWIVRESR